MRSTPRATIILTLCIALVLTYSVLSVSHRALVASTTEVTVSGIALTLPAHGTHCQPQEFIPKQARVARVFASTPGAPAVGSFSLNAEGAGTRFTVRSANAGPGAVYLPLPPRDRTLDPATVCFTNSGQSPLQLAGNLTALNPGALHATPALGRPPTDEVRVDFFGPSRTWFAIASDVAFRWSLFRPFDLPPSALWIVLAIAVMALAGGVRQFVSPKFWRAALPAQVRRTVLVCAGVAVSMGVVWSLVTPDLQGPDESAHSAYAERLGRTGALPVTGAGIARGESLPGHLALLTRGLPFNVEANPLWSPWQERSFFTAERHTPDVNGSGASYIAGNPPLYYAVLAPVARATKGASAPNQLLLMRLVSALLSGLTAALTVLFLRETFPRHPQAWLFGGLAVASQPLFSFVSGVVNADNLLFATTAGLLWVMARLLRRGPTPATALALAGFALAGVLTKSTFYVLLPGAGLALVASTLMFRRTANRAGALRASLIGSGSFAVGLAVWLEINSHLLNRNGTITRGYLAGTPGSSWSVRGLLSYTWQFFLPRLPFMRNQFPTYPKHPLWDVYFRGFVGRFGAFQFGFPTWVDYVALALLTVVVGLAAVSVARAVRRSWRVIVRLVLYAATALSLLALITYTGYTFRVRFGGAFEQTRYLLPLLPLYGALFSAALIALPQRWRLPTGAAVLTILALHNVSGLLLTLGRYYG
ncbi:MAG: glycosyltransferase family 39 protein [Solirubrobacteraceae bacterium]